MSGTKCNLFLRTIVVMASAVAPMMGQSRLVVDSATILNRTGMWAEAAAIAQAELGREKDPELRCPLLVSVAYSTLRIARNFQGSSTGFPVAETALVDAEKGCAGTKTDRALMAELASLRVELEAADKTAPKPVQSAQIATPAQEDGFWKTGDAVTVGIDPAVLAEQLKLCQVTGGDACLVARHGVIVQEWYGPLYQVPMYAMSSTKSIAGLLTGMLIADGRIGNVGMPVCSFLPEWCTGVRAKVLLGHVLTMTAGIPMMQDSGVGNRGHKSDFVRTLQPTSEPGTVWAYSNETAQLLEPILTKAAGEPIQDYAARRLFAPLGMRNTRLHFYDDAWLYADMETTLRDFARIGILALQKGAWQGKQIVAAEWFAQITKPQRLNPNYGMLWWVDTSSKSFSTQGYLGTDIQVLPDLDLIIVRMQSKALPGGSTESEYRRKSTLLARKMVKKEG